ncbi:MAG: hypothetical protein KDK36_04300 [Leptospiraceae bacterium]|nr:hypothetical protein [Leptospiraceae bacterium]
MSFGFIFIFPICLGAITVYFSGEEQRKSIMFQIFMPALVSTLSLFISMIAGWEGTICLIMALPIYWVLSIAGGLITGFVLARLKNKNMQLLSFSFLLISPFISGISESYISLPSEIRTVQTQIKISAKPEEIWSQIARIPKITEEQNGFFYFMGFPKPVEATLSHEGVGGVREAIFEKGLMFLETITIWEENRKLRFTIKSQPEFTPLTTLDPHVVVGGDYFDTLSGEYEIEKINEKESILHLQSQFRVSTRFNFYANLWADYLMADIQNNILRVLKTRTENLVKKDSQK